MTYSNLMNILEVIKWAISREVDTAWKGFEACSNERKWVYTVVYFFPLYTPPHRQMAVFGGSQKKEPASQRHDVTARHPAPYNRGENHKHTHTLSLSFYILNLEHSHTLLSKHPLNTAQMENTCTDKESCRKFREAGEVERRPHL